MRFLPVPFLAVAFLSISGTAALDADTSRLLVYVGTGTSGDSEGIYLYELDLTSGELTSRGLAAEASDPSFVALHPHEPILYSIDQITDSSGRRTGAVSAFSIDEDTGKLQRLNQQPSGGGGPCHVTIDGTGQTVLVANYGGGSISAYPVLQDGRLGESTSFIQHEGSGPNQRRQRGPHAHSVNVDSASRFAFAADLGTDEVRIYKLDAAQALLEPNDPPAAKLAPGAGPRHFTFHPNGRHAYVINELDNTITAFTYDSDGGALEELQTVPTLPESFQGENTTAEILMHPSGKYIYGSNRGHDSIVAFAVADDGKLTFIEHQSTLGNHPRNFGIDPTGQILIVANRDSNNLVPFRIDADSGKLTAVGPTYTIHTPLCVRFRQ